MKIFNRGSWKFLVISIMIMLSAFFFFTPYSLASQASETLVIEGRAILFNNINSHNPTYSALLAANDKFKAACNEDSTDPIANLFYAVTRFIAFALGQGDGADPETLMDLAGIFGIPRAENDYLDNGPPFEEKEIYGKTCFDDSVPIGETVRAFIADPFIKTIDDSIYNLNVIQSGFQAILTPGETGDTSVEVDYGDVLVLKSALHTLKATLHILTAYNMDIDIHILSVLGNGRVLQFQRDLLDKYPDLLRLRPADGSQSLSMARQSLINGINTFAEAFAFISAEQDYQEDDLLYFESDEEKNEAEVLLKDLSEIISSFNENRVAVSTRIHETWILTDELYNRVQMVITKDMNGNFESGDAHGVDGCDFLFCSGWIKSYEVSGSNVTIQMASIWWDCGEVNYTLTGQLSNGQILNGEYSYIDCYSNTKSGVFVGQLDSEDEETDRMDLNRIFGNTGKSPLDIRAILPQLYENDDIIPGTFPGSPVLNGIFPDISTNSDLTEELELEPISDDLTSITGTISCQAHNGAGNIFIYAFDGPDFRNARLLSANYISSPGSYELWGLPAGINVFLFARWDRDDNGIRTFGDFGGFGGNHIVPMGSLTGINFNLDQEIDDSYIMTKPGLYRVFGSNSFYIPQDYQGPWNPNEISWNRSDWTFIGESDRTEIFSTDRYYATLLFIWHSNSIFNFDSVEDLAAGTAFAVDEDGNPVGYSWVASGLRNFDTEEWIEPYYFKGHPDRLYAKTPDWYGFSLFSMPAGSVDPNSPRQLRVTLLSNKAGDINGDNEVNLKDVITILKTVVASNPEHLYPNIYSDSRTGLEEAIEAIRIIAGLSSNPQ